MSILIKTEERMASSVKPSSTANNLTTSSSSDVSQPLPPAFTEFYDDSSDKDDSSDRLQHEILADVFKFQKRNDNGPIFSCSRRRAMLSFINFSSGLALYNNATVKTTYRLWKKEHLGDCIVPSEDLVTSVFNKVIHKGITDCIQLKPHKEAMKKLTQGCLEHKPVNLNRITLLNCLKVNLRAIMRWVIVDADFPDKILPSMLSIHRTIRDYLENLDYSTIIRQRHLDLPLKITAYNLHSEMREYLEKQYHAVISKVHSMRKLLEQENLLTSNKQRISASEKSKKRITQILRRGRLSNIKNNYLTRASQLTHSVSADDFECEFISAFLQHKMQAVIEREIGRGDLSIIQNKRLREDANIAESEFCQYEKYMKAFEPCTIDGLKKLVNETISKTERSFVRNLIALLQNAIQKEFEQHAWRRSLPTLYLHKIRSSVDYIASLRLTQRSLYRSYRNQSLEESDLSKSKEEHHDIGWQFQHIGSSCIVVERTRITANACSSLVQIQTGANSYARLGEKIQDFLRNHHDYSDSFIVTSIREIINHGKTPELVKLILPKVSHDITLFLVQLAHLFVGTESSRYPAALIQSQMVMDLIGKKKLTWLQAFTEHESRCFYPMILKKTTNICRTLATTFRDFTFYSHIYPGNLLDIDAERVLEYIRAEYKLPKKWLQIKDMPAKIDEENIETIQQTINNAVGRWYPTSVLAM